MFFIFFSESKPMLKVERLEENAGNRIRSNISYLFLFSVIAALIQLENG